MDATPQPYGPGQLPLGVERRDTTVSVAFLVPELTTALAKIGRLHLDLFNRPLIITSGSDGMHKGGSKHHVNKAVDLRMSDKALREQALFVDILMYLHARLHFAFMEWTTAHGECVMHMETVE